jgi:hypothetical protein
MSTSSSSGEAKAIIDRAIKASGGQTKFKAQTWSEKGTNYWTDTPATYTAWVAMQFPDQCRLRQGDSIVVVGRDKGWLVGGNTTKEMTREQLASQKEYLYGVWVSSLLPLNDKEFTLSPLGKSKVDDRAVVGVKVSSKGHKDVELYFDETTNLLVKSALTVQVVDLWGESAGRATVVRQEVFYSDYRAVQGVQVPMKMVIKHDGKLVVKSEKHDIQLVDKLDDKEFSKP